jgi:hypothetical protein
MVALQPNINMSDKPSKNKPRKRVNTAEKRASHNLVERQRREQLNGRFLDLAKLLPSLATQKRPSKSAIVNGSITHLMGQRNARLIAARELKTLFAENQDLLKELNEYRVQSGKDAKLSMGWTEGMAEVVKVEDETFGTFTSFDEDGMDGDDPADQDEYEAQNGADADPAYLTVPSANMGYAGNGALPTSMLGAYPQGDMFMHSTVKHEHNFSRYPTLLNRQSSFSSSSPSSQEGLSNRQQALLMMQQHGPIGLEHYGAGHISPSAGRGSFSQADMRNHVPQDYLTSPQLGQDPSSHEVTEMPYGDKVSSWTAQQQQMLLMAQHRRNTVPVPNQASWIEYAGLSHDIGAQANARSQSMSQYHSNALTSQLTDAHVTLLARQPHLAAAVFPPACSAELAASNAMAEYSPEPHLGMALQTGNASALGFDQWQKMNRTMNFDAHPTPSLPTTIPGMGNVHRTPTSTASGSSPSSMGGPTVSELREAVRHGMSVGMSLGMPTWSTEMEGYA